MYSSSDNLIGNPTYDITFKDPFGPNGTIIDNQSGQDRLLSFIQDLYSSDDIKFIQYMEAFS